MSKKLLIEEDDGTLIDLYPKEKKAMVVTEDLGKIFEMAICLLYEIEFDGQYKYSMSEATKLRERIVKLKTAFPHSIKHTAKNGSQYDFTGLEDETIKLSAKTTIILYQFLSASKYQEKKTAVKKSSFQHQYLIKAATQLSCARFGCFHF